MATGLLIRDFFKQYREARYSDRGSLTVSGIEHNAYRLSLTLEITHLDSPRYGNLKTLPENTHYGYVTLFRGSTVTETIPVKYPKVRIFDIINQGIWNHHQHSESLQIGTLVSSESSEFAARGILEKIGGVVDTTVCVVWRFLDVLGEDFVDKFVYNVFGCSESDLPVDGKELDKYRAFPVATPFPDIAKFKGDVPLSFLWRLEQWYLVNPAVYITDNPTDASDETDGEDEYPIPDQGDGDGDGSEFPIPDEPPLGADSRDFAPQNSGDPNASGSTNIFANIVAYTEPLGSTNTATFSYFVMQVPGRATAAAVTTSCNAFTGNNFAAPNKCFQLDVSCFGQTVRLPFTIESISFSPVYFP